MMIPGFFYTFLCGSHAVGWALVAQKAREDKFVDLCQFVRAFVFSPFIFAFALGAVMAGGFFIKSIIAPNIGHILLGLGTVFGVVFVLCAVGYFVVVPAVKKAYGVAKPFSEKICIVLYKSTK